MTMRLTEHQLAFLRNEPLPKGHANKLRLATGIARASVEKLGEITGISPAQLARYLNGGDLLMSTAYHIASVFGATVCDLWPSPPAAKAVRSQRRAAARKRINAKQGGGAKAQVAA